MASFYSTHYRSGEDIRAGDRISWAGSPGCVVFVLPLMMDYSEEREERLRWGLVSFVMLVVCVSEYWGFGSVGVDERYAQWSVGVLVGILAIFIAMAREVWPARTPAASEGGAARADAPKPT